MVGSLTISVPVAPAAPILNPDGSLNQVWHTFFVTLWTRTGGNSASLSPQLDQISQTQGALITRGPSVWQALIPAGPNLFLVANGAEIPGYRLIQSADLDNLAGQYPGAAAGIAAAPGNIGEFLSAQVTIGSAIPLTSGMSADVVTLALTPGDWDVWGTFVSVPAGGTTQSDIRAWINTASATDPNPPNMGAYAELQFGTTNPIGAGLNQTLAVGTIRQLANAGATVHLSANVTFASSTLGGAGFLGARRRH